MTVERPPIRTAAIVAAGFGSRLNELTAAMPKGFLEIGGQSLIERSLDTLRGFGIERVVLGTGYQAHFYDLLAERRGDVVTVLSERYASTSSMVTLWGLRHALVGPFILLESDLLYEPRAIAELLDHPAEDVILASDATRSGDEVYIETTDGGHLVAMSKDRAKLGRVDAELVGISKISDATFRAMCDVMEARLETQPKLDYESALVAVGRVKPIPVHRVDGLAWCEIDDADHLARANAHVLPRVEAAHAEAGRRTR